MKKLLFILTLLFIQVVQAQQEMEGNVFDMRSNIGLANVHVLNLNEVIGTVTDSKGNFKIRASVNDTLYFSFLGHKSVKVSVTNDMIKFPGTKIGMSELAYALEEVIISPFQLTGYLEIDAKRIPLNNNIRYSISGLEVGYEGRADASAIGRVFSAIFNPSDFLYKTFSSKEKELRKLQRMREDNKLSDMISTRYDRETLTELLQIDRAELEEMLRFCNYSSDFIITANDLQVLEAISECYDQYRVLSRNKRK